MFYVDFSFGEYSELFSQTIELRYIYDKNETAVLTEKVKKVCNKILSRVSGQTDYEKELSLHDVLVENIVYHDVAKNNLEKYRFRSNTILGSLLYKTAVILGDQTLYVAGNHTFDRCYVNEYYAKDKTAQGFVLEIEPSTSQDQIEYVIDEVRKIIGNLNCSLNSADIFEEAEQSIHAAEAGISLFAGISAWIITLAVLIAALLKTDKIFKLVGATVADRAGVCILITIFVLTVSCLPSAVLFYALLM